MVYPQELLWPNLASIDVFSKACAAYILRRLKYILDIRDEVLKAEAILIMVFWAVMPYGNILSSSSRLKLQP
jgi:hypothetical protein